MLSCEKNEIIGEMWINENKFAHNISNQTHLTSQAVLMKGKWCITGGGAAVEWCSGGEVRWWRGGAVEWRQERSGAVDQSAMVDAPE